MSTNKNKLYTFKDIERAKASDSEVKRYFTRKSERRKTRQIRIGEKWHKKIKETAITEKIVMSFLLDKICKQFFSQ